MPRRACLLLFPALALAASVPAPASLAQSPEDEAEEAELLTLAGLAPIARRDGEVIRYVLRRAFHSNNRPSARIVEVRWPYDADHPRVLLIELAKPGDAWRITERREALMHPVPFDRLVRNVAAAASVVGERPDRGAVYVCSHADSSRLELSLPARQLRLTRTAHCSHDAPAVVAGELLAEAVALNLQVDWSPRD